MYLPSLKGWLQALAFTAAALLLGTGVNAQPVRQSAQAAGKRPATANNKLDAGTTSKSAKNSPAARQRDELADDDSSSDKPKAKPGPKDAAKSMPGKKGQKSATREQGSMSRSPARRPRSDTGSGSGSVLMGGSLNLEPES
jgi:hypothetical protein